MKREPSINITESNLILVIQKIFTKEAMSEFEIKKLVIHILCLAKPFSITNRKILLDNNHLEKRITKLNASNRNDADLFANLLLNIRRKLKHRGIQQVKPNTKDWLLIKDITGYANDFCNEWNLDKREGYLEYINIALSKMNKFSLIKFPNMVQSISQTYEAKQFLFNDNSPEETLSIHNLYQRIITEKTGLPSDYTKNPDKYLYFLKVKQIAENIGIKPSIYIKAQFASFEWRDGVPDPIQLVGDKAIERLNKYLYENNIKINKSNKKVNWSRILKAE
jgi:hypothetical protein